MTNKLLFVKIDDGCQVGNGNAGSGLVGSLVNSKIEIPPYANIENALYPVVSLSDFCFREISGLKSVVLPSTLKTLGTDSFWKTSITKLIIPSSVEKLSSFCLSTMLQLKILIFEGEIKEFGYRSIQTCVSLEKIYYCGMNDVSEINDPLFVDAGYEAKDPSVYVPSSYPSTWTFGSHPVLHMDVCPTKKCTCNCHNHKYSPISRVLCVSLLWVLI